MLNNTQKQAAGFNLNGSLLIIEEQKRIVMTSLLLALFFMPLLAGFEVTHGLTVLACIFTGFYTVFTFALDREEKQELRESVNYAFVAGLELIKAEFDTAGQALRTAGKALKASAAELKASVAGFVAGLSFAGSEEQASEPASRYTGESLNGLRITFNLREILSKAGQTGQQIKPGKFSSAAGSEEEKPVILESKPVLSFSVCEANKNLTFSFYNAHARKIARSAVQKRRALIKAQEPGKAKSKPGSGQALEVKPRSKTIRRASKQSRACAV